MAQGLDGRHRDENGQVDCRKTRRHSDKYASQAQLSGTATILQLRVVRRTQEQACRKSKASCCARFAASEEGFTVAKWADYLISAVQYNQGETHIDYVKEHIDKGDSVGAATVSARSTVVSRIKTGTTYVTVTMNSENKYVKGASVEVITVDGVEYIKTVADSTKKDNLGELPRF